MIAGQDTDVEHIDVAAVLADKSNDVQAPTFGAGAHRAEACRQGGALGAYAPPISKTQKNTDTVHNTPCVEELRYTF